MTMINFVCEQKESYSAIVRWQELSFVKHILFALSLVENNFLQIQGQERRSLSQTVEPGACPTCNSQISVSTHCTPD